MDEDESAEGLLKLLLRETLERNRAFVAGMSSGVPTDAVLQYKDAIVDDLARVIGPLILQPEDDDTAKALVRGAQGNLALDSIDRGWQDQSRTQQHP